VSIQIRENPIGDLLQSRRGNGKAHLTDFIEVCSEIYRDDPHYIRQMDWEFKQRFSKKNPFFHHGEGAIFTAERHGKTIGRCSAQIDWEHQARYQDKAGFFGYFDTLDDQDAAKALVDAASAWLSKRSMKTIRGPLSFSLNEEAGCLVHGFDTPPMIMMPHHRPYQGGLLEGAGLRKLKDLFAWYYEVGALPKRAQKAAANIENLPEITTRQITSKTLAADVHIVMDIFNDAWSDNWGFVPLTAPEIQKMADDLKMILVPDLTMIVSINGSPAAVAVALPNLNEVIRDFDGRFGPVQIAKLLWRIKVKHPSQARLIILGIRKQYRHSKRYGALSAFMYSKMHQGGQRCGYLSGELSWTLEDNGAINAGIRLMGGKHYKTYRIYENDLLRNVVVSRLNSP
jgi:hypothetical protein